MDELSEGMGISFNVEIEELSTTNQPFNKVVKLIGVVSSPVVYRTRESKCFPFLTNQTSTSVDVVSNVMFQVVETGHGGCLFVFMNQAYRAQERRMPNDMKRRDA
jgi:hypothetical protein